MISRVSDDHHGKRQNVNRRRWHTFVYLCFCEYNDDCETTSVLCVFTVKRFTPDKYGYLIVCTKKYYNSNVFLRLVETRIQRAEDAEPECGEAFPRCERTCTTSIAYSKTFDWVGTAKITGSRGRPLRAAGDGGERDDSIGVHSHRGSETRSNVQFQSPRTPRVHRRQIT